MDELIQKKTEFLTVPVSAQLKAKVREYARLNNVTMSAATRMILHQFLSADFGKSKVKVQK
jgi:hypothetical protein